jgi:hypothetical protein
MKRLHCGKLWALRDMLDPCVQDDFEDGGGLLLVTCPTCGSTVSVLLALVPIDELGELPGIEAVITERGVSFVNAAELEDAMARAA